MQIVACLKLIDRCPPTADVDAVDERFSGMSAADEAALEWALAIGARWAVPVVAVSFGAGAADQVLRTALAAGVDSVVRINGSPAADSCEVAGGVAATVDRGDLVICGDYSMDRGSGSVPGFIAAMLDVPQALGLVGLTVTGDRSIEGLRRLDGGRRERLGLELHRARGAVVSVEGSTARLRRAGLSAVRRSRTATIPMAPATLNVTTATAPAPNLRPFRPRPRVLAGPVGEHPLDRLRALTASSAGTSAAAGESVVLEPEAAADRIVQALTAWGYLSKPC